MRPRRGRSCTPSASPTPPSSAPSAAASGRARCPTGWSPTAAMASGLASRRRRRKPSCGPRSRPPARRDPWLRDHPATVDVGVAASASAEARPGSPSRWPGGDVAAAVPGAGRPPSAFPTARTCRCSSTRGDADRAVRSRRRPGRPRRRRARRPGRGRGLCPHAGGVDRPRARASLRPARRGPSGPRCSYFLPARFLPCFFLPRSLRGDRWPRSSAPAGALRQRRSARVGRGGRRMLRGCAPGPRVDRKGIHPAPQPRSRPARAGRSGASPRGAR